MAPISEESIKLLFIVSIVAILRLIVSLDTTWKSEFKMLILITIFIGVFLSLFERLFVYPYEHPFSSVLRLATHPTYSLWGSLWLFFSGGVVWDPLKDFGLE